jgi:hypothetical protein
MGLTRMKGTGIQSLGNEVVTKKRIDTLTIKPRRRESFLAPRIWITLSCSQHESWRDTTIGHVLFDSLQSQASIT